MQVLASLNHLVDINRAWKEFVKSNIVNQQVVRPLIARSWKRCSIFGIDPYTQPVQDVLRGSALQARLDRSHDLLRVAFPLMKVLVKTCGDDFVAVLVDDEGYNISDYGNPDAIEWAVKNRTGKGANLYERVTGTNGLGTVLVERVPMQILANECYRQSYHEWTWMSSAAPILGPSGNLIGVLTIHGHCSKVHPHTLGLVIMAVKAIENQLRLEEVCDDLNKMQDYSHAMLEAFTEGLVTVNQNGIITGINEAGSRIMGLGAAKIGRSLADIGSPLKPLQEAIDSGNIMDQEIVLDNDREGCCFTIQSRPVKSKQGQIIGMVSTLREINAVPQPVKNMHAYPTRFTFDGLIGENELFQKAVFLARRAAMSNSTILLQGESGTGKEMFAQAVHNASARSDQLFVAVNCGAIPRDLIESELFGYEEGAFTGAKRGGCQGKFELASRGTIFLDEIGDMPIELQVTLLRVLQEKNVTRLGGSKVIPVNVRVIAATNRDLKKVILKGRFREDLYYRLNIFDINIPPLRERQSDIELLAEHLVGKITRLLGKTGIRISSEVLSCLTQYSWPGNIRELENAMERAINLAPGDLIETEHLPDYLVEKQNQLTLKSGPVITLTLQEMERQAIISALNALERNVVQTARVLGVSRSTLYNKIREYKIKV